LKYTIFRAASFKKDFNKLSSENQESLLDVIEQRANGKMLKEKHKEHML